MHLESEKRKPMNFYKIDGRSDFGKQYINSFRFETIMTNMALNDFCRYTGIRKQGAKIVHDTVVINEEEYNRLSKYYQKFFKQLLKMYYLQPNNEWGAYIDVLIRALEEVREPNLLDYIDDWNGDNLKLTTEERYHVVDSEIVTDTVDVFVKTVGKIYVDNVDIFECLPEDFMTARNKQIDIVLYSVGEFNERL